ncbi:hypothetical protein BU23DRAFT_213408 [Bimuria novae-zelandiae CBS 107.79]|uniref:Uncharacterized protein n=1 Tax=Bimuria novae-zelandiae CBS 107.79 TaxID=1447943 RepID=A0A6A5UZL2_9PLEO|nr:hypothetical protein BU23DRAFT_213408 [Bimuria novae-zelandiae CBS 107.79]
MVLQDIEAPPDSFTDNPYPSDNDAYTSSASPDKKIDASTLPQPIPVLGPLLGFSQRAIKFKVDSTLTFAERKLHRPLTYEESYALSTHLYKLEQTKSYLTAIGAGFGGYRWYTTWEQCRYPLYKPKPEDINPNKFLFFKGPAANAARHSWRLFCYTFVAAELGKLVGQIIAQPNAAQAASNDPRLKDFADALKTSISSENARISNRTARSSSDERRAAWEEAARARNAERSTPGAPAQVPWNVRKPTSADDDMSPTAGNEPWSSSSDSSWGNETLPSDAPPNAEAQRQPSNPYSRPSRSSRRDDDNDASPTGGMFQDEVQSQSKPGESAWERLRRGGAPTQGSSSSTNGRQPPYQEQKGGSTQGDSFNFVDSDDERRQEKERAQREFDARIEQERRGKDFNQERSW